MHSVGSELIKASPTKQMGDGLSVLDPMRVRIDSKAKNIFAIQDLLSARYGPEWDQNTKGPYNPQNIHAEISANGQIVKTAVGQGRTWVANRGWGSDLAGR